MKNVKQRKLLKQYNSQFLIQIQKIYFDKIIENIIIFKYLNTFDKK